MQIVCISRGSSSKGEELAGALAGKLGWPCVSREEMVEEAIKRGIAVGKLETAVLTPHIFTEKLALEKDHYQAFSTMYLLERAKKENIVYHGRAGHLLLPGLDQLLRIRVVADTEYRIRSVMQKLNLSRRKARSYIENVDEDRARWVKLYFGVDWDDPENYDVVINVAQMSVKNTSAALCAMVQLPDFQTTPASAKVTDNLLLAARARVALAENDRTYNGQFTVHADDGLVSVIYKLQQSELAEHVPGVLRKVKGVREVVCTMARSNILWIQEKFDAGSDSFKEVVSLARKWGAAVELLRLEAQEENGGGATATAQAPNGATGWASPENGAPSVRTTIVHHGGVEDDGAAGAAENEEHDGGLSNTLAELALQDRSGGGRSIRATPRRTAENIDQRVNYTLVVLGDLFLSKGHAAQTRMINELSGLLGEKIKAPVVTTRDLKQQYLFSPKQFLRMLLFFAAAAAVYLAVFTHQQWVLNFTHGEDTTAKILAAVCIFCFVPAIAFLYGNATKLLLKLIRIE